MVSSMVSSTLLFLTFFLALFGHLNFCLGDTQSPFSNTTSYPLPNKGNIPVHDPSIIEHHGFFYLFRGMEPRIGIHRAPNLSGPWTKVGTVLSGDAKISKDHTEQLWAPNVVEWRSEFYCFYSTSVSGSKNSAIGVATTNSQDLDSTITYNDGVAGNNNGNHRNGSWVDHGALVETGSGKYSHEFPYNMSNAIDPSFVIDPVSQQPYLNFGSYWSDIWQVPLMPDLLGVKDAEDPDAVHLAYSPYPDLSGERPLEGSFISFKEPYYYLWISHGQCCSFKTLGFPERGEEYDIKVGRSKSPRGPFVDAKGRNLTDNGGTVVYASNHDTVYAPGGVGVLPGHGSRPDILYYHYRGAARLERACLFGRMAGSATEWLATSFQLSIDSRVEDTEIDWYRLSLRGSGPEKKAMHAF